MKSAINIFYVSFIFFFLEAQAREIDVKYLGTIKIDGFKCVLTSSSLINEACYQKSSNKLFVSLNGTFYGYCGVDEVLYSNLLQASSLGKFYNEKIRGKFDCR